MKRKGENPEYRLVFEMRDSQSYPWTWTLYAPNGEVVADGICKYRVGGKLLARLAKRAHLKKTRRAQRHGGEKYEMTI